MSTNYDDCYATGPDVLGPPTKRLVRLLSRELTPGSTVLDVGCGQGRDALWLARAGHRVTGIDTSGVGIGQLREIVEAEGLPVEAIEVALEDYAPTPGIDCILFDRTLHMLDAGPRVAGFSRLIGAVAPGGLIVVLDEAPNLATLRAVLGPEWTKVWTDRSGFAVRRT